MQTVSHIVCFLTLTIIPVLVYQQDGLMVLSGRTQSTQITDNQTRNAVNA